MQWIQVLTVLKADPQIADFSLPLPENSSEEPTVTDDSDPKRL